jgi:hypothetical protein
LCGRDSYQGECNVKSEQHFDNCACLMERTKAVEVLMEELEYDQVLMQAAQCLDNCVGKTGWKGGKVLTFALLLLWGMPVNRKKLWLGLHKSLQRAKQLAYQEIHQA